VAKIDSRLQVDAATALTVTGTVPIDGPGLDLRAQTDGVKLALFEPMAAGHLERLDGLLKLDLAITGEVKAPSVRGEVGIADGQFRLTPTGEDYRRLNASVRFDGDRVQVDHFSVEDDDGHALTASGTSAGGGLERSLNIDVKSSGIHILRNQLGELALRTDLRATGSMQAPHVTGSIGVERGRLEVDKLLARFSSNAYAPVQDKKTEGVAAGEPPAEPQKPARFSDATMDVQLNVPDNLVLRGRDLRTAARGSGLGDVNVTAGGTVRVQKLSGSPMTLLGEVAIVRGNYSFQSRRFEIERGSAVRFLGTDTLDPTLAIAATREISGVTARVAVTGTLSRPQIELSSNPPLDPGDVLSLIVFNQPINELGEGEQVSLAERAGQLAASAIATPISDSVARALDLDVFEIQSGEAGGNGPTITVGRQVSDRLFVGFRHEFGSDEASRVSFEYQLRRFMRIVTSIGQGSNPNRIPREETAGLDLFFVIKR
jgi:translocation and assembly module TamB